MRVVIAAEIFPPTTGGPATYSEKLAYALDKQGHKIVVLCYSSGDTDNRSYPFDVIRTPLSPFKIGHYLSYMYLLFKHARQAHTVYAQGPVAAGLPSYIVCWLLSKKLIIKVVGDYAWEQARNKGRSRERIDAFQNAPQSGITRAHRFIERLTTRGATAIIVPSNYLKKIVMGWGVEEHKIIIIYNAAPEIATQHRENKEYDTIVSYGRFVPWKGFEALIETMPALIKYNNKFRMLLLGRGPLEDTLKQRIKALSLEEYVKVQYMKPEDRDSILSEAKLYVLNTDYEGLSHALLEVMAAGVPIVTTDVGGNPELIEHEKNGLLVKFNDKQALIDALITLNKDRDMRAKFIKEGQSRARLFSEERMFQDTLNVLETI